MTKRLYGPWILCCWIGNDIRKSIDRSDAAHFQVPLLLLPFRYNGRLCVFAYREYLQYASALALIAQVRIQHGDRRAFPYHEGRRLEV